MEKEKTFLSADEILRIPDMETEEVYIPEWHTHVKVKSLTAQERDRFELEIAGSNQKPSSAQVRARLVALTVVNGDGKPMFTADQIGELGNKNAAAMDRIFTVARRLSAFGEQDIEGLSGN